MDTPLRVGVIGVGMMGEVHARNLSRSREARVVALASAGGPRLAAFARELGVDAIYSDGRDLIANASVDAVVIASPDQTHAAYALACIGAGTPALCEKPMATTTSEASAICDAEVAEGKPLITVGFMRDYDDAHVAVGRAVRDGKVGRPLMFRSIHVTPDDGPAMLSPAELVSMGVIHDIHSARRLMGSEVRDVYVRWIPMDPARDDTCRLLTVSCAFDDGALGLMDINIEAAYGYAVSVEVVGTHGTVTSVHPSRASLRTPHEVRQDIDRDPMARYGPAYAAEIHDWARAVMVGAPTGASAWDGYVSAAVADACITSIASGRPEPVQLRPRPALYA